MADIELVIKIPEEIHERVGYEYCEYGAISKHTNNIILDAFCNGTPLPKGHGRLIDGDELYSDFIDGTEGYDCNTWNRIEIGCVIEDTPTIIEADKEQEK